MRQNKNDETNEINEDVNSNGNIVGWDFCM